jgi:hypothetical protein
VWTFLPYTKERLDVKMFHEVLNDMHGLSKLVRLTDWSLCNFFAHDFNANGLFGVIGRMHKRCI